MPRWQLRKGIGRYLALLFVLSIYSLTLFIFFSGIRQWMDSDEITLPELDARGLPIFKPGRKRGLSLNPGWKLLYPNRKFVREKHNRKELIQGAWSPPLDHYNRSYSHAPGYVSESSDMCNTDTDRYPIVLFVFVESAPSNIERRKQWRQHWGSKQEWLRIAFVVGLSASENINVANVEENSIHNDMVILNFTDSYSGLTTKTATMLKWIYDNCAHARFVLKTDDDVIVYFSGLRDYLDKLNYNDTLYAGSASSPKPLRTKSKWKVSYHHYPFELYPEYVLGAGILMSMPTVLKFYDESRHIPLFPFEDVFIGFCAKASKVRLTALKTFQGGGKAKQSEKGIVKLMFEGKLVLCHGINNKRITHIWTSLQSVLRKGQNS